MNRLNFALCNQKSHFCKKKSDWFLKVCSFCSLFFCLSLQSLDEDCTLEEEDEGLIGEEDEIDQFNDDTFGAGAIGESCVKYI